MILTEFDYEKNAIINPWHTSDMVQGMPKVAVTCFSRVTFARMLSAFGGEIIANTNVANMEIPVYKSRAGKPRNFLQLSDNDVEFCRNVVQATARCVLVSLCVV